MCAAKLQVRFNLFLVFKVLDPVLPAKGFESVRGQSKCIITVFFFTDNLILIHKTVGHKDIITSTS